MWIEITINNNDILLLDGTVLYNNQWITVEKTQHFRINNNDKLNLSLTKNDGFENASNMYPWVHDLIYSNSNKYENENEGLFISNWG